MFQVWSPLLAPSSRMGLRSSIYWYGCDGAGGMPTAAVGYFSSHVRFVRNDQGLVIRLHTTEVAAEWIRPGDRTGAHTVSACHPSTSLNLTGIASTRST